MTSGTKPRPPRGSAFSLAKPVVFWGVTAALLTFLAVALLYTATIESVTFDEPTYITAGYNYFVQGDYWFNAEHPPLAKLIAAAPLLPFDLRLPAEHPDFQSKHPQTGARPFVFGNRLPPDRIVFLARLPFAMLTVAFGMVLAIWTRRVFGPAAAILALLFYALDPTVISHGHYAATDFVTAVFFFLTCIAWVWYLETRGWGALLLAGLALGLALASKFSSLLLLGILPLLAVVRWWQVPRRFPALRTAGALLVVLAMAIGTVGLTYLPMQEDVFNPWYPRLHELADKSVAAGRTLGWLGERLDLPYHPYAHGIIYQARHNQGGHLTYLAGQRSATGWWYYFPATFLLKTPLAIQLGLLAALVWALAGWRRDRLALIEAAPLPWMVLVLTPLLYMGFAMNSNINIGQRYLLPIYPFLYVLAGASLARIRIRWLAPALALLVMVEHALIAPHYLAYFNPLAGGAAKAPQYLLDSNIDWGQDLLKLRNYMQERGLRRICAAYFGTADLKYYGVNFDLPPTWRQLESKGTPNCVAALSVTYLYGAYSEEDHYRWLREFEPDERIGYSIYVYDLRAKTE